MNNNLQIRTEQIVSNIQFLNYNFYTILTERGEVFLKAEYPDADIYTGIVEIQHTRKRLVTPAMTNSEIVQTAFKLALTSMEHRTREAFKYRNARIFGPHFDVEDLVSLCVLRENVGGRNA